MNEINNINLSEQTKLRLSGIIWIEDYFHQEINQRKSCNKKLDKYVAVFDCIDQALVVLSATSGGVSIISFASIFGAPVGIASASLTLFFSLTTGIVKKLLNITRNKKKKHDKVLMLAKSKLNSIETLISQALIDMEISHEEFITILDEKDKYEKTKDNLRSENKKYKVMRLSSIKSVFEYFMPSKNNLFFLCMYEMVDISVETWNKVEVSVINIHENDNANKALSILICISDIAKRWSGKNIYHLID